MIPSSQDNVAESQGSQSNSPFEASNLQAWKKAQDTINEVNKRVHDQRIQILSLKAGQQSAKGKDHMSILQACRRQLQQSSDSKSFEKIKDQLSKSQTDKFISIEKQFQKKLSESLAKEQSSHKRIIESLSQQLEQLSQQNKQLKQLKMNAKKTQIVERTNEELRKLQQADRQTIKRLQEDRDNDAQMYNEEIRKMNQRLAIIESQSAKKIKEQQDFKRLSLLSTNKDLLNSALCLRALDCVKQFEKVTDSPKIKLQLKQFLSIIAIDRSRSQDLKKLYQKVQIEAKFKMVVQQLAGQFRSIKNQKVAEREDFQQRKKNLENQIRTLGEGNNKLERQLKSMKETVDRLQRESAKQIQVIGDKQEEIKGLLRNEKTNNDKLNENKDKISFLQKKIKELQGKCVGAETQNEKLKTLIRQTEIVKTSAQRSAKQKQAALREQISKLQKQIIKLKAIAKQDQSLIKNYTGKIEALEKKVEEYYRMIADGDSQVKSLQGQIQTLKAQLKNAVDKAKSLQRQVVDVKNDWNELKRQMTGLNQKLQDTKSQLLDTRKFAQGFKFLNGFLPEISYFINREKLQFNLNNPEKSVKELLKWFKARYNEAKFFRDSEIIQIQYIDFLTAEIQSFTSSVISEIKLLYRYDPRNNANFHQYIDGKENLLVLFKLATNNIVGGFSCFPMEKLDREKAKQIGYGRGFIFNLTKFKVFQLRREPKMPVLTFDDYFFIFGNSELRLKPSERKFFTSFGIANSSFDNVGVTRQQFIDKEGNEVDCLQFECYQVKLRM